jgi:cleavage and polyadenylation specificity factor subunit 2
VKLADPLVKRLKWQNVRGLGIVTVTGMLLPGGEFAEMDHGDGTNKRLKLDGESPTDSSSTAVVPASNSITIVGHGAGTAAHVPTLDALPTNLASAVRSVAQPLHVGDLRLADLRRAMLNGGHKAEFRGEGTLVIDDSVAVRKSLTGRIEIESVALPTDLASNGPMGGGVMNGLMGGTFYAVRRKIYEGLAVVAGA